MTARLVGWVPTKGRVEVVLDDLVRLGATADNEVVIPIDGVSRAHAKIVKQTDGYYLEDASSRNGTWVNGERVSKKMLRHLDVITLGRYADVVFVNATSDAAKGPAAGITASLEWLDPPDRGRRMELTRGELIVGRAPSCQIVIDDPAVSRAHARFIVTGSTVTVEDLGSINGTFVGPERITRPMALSPGAVIGFGEPGAFRLRIEGTPANVSSASYVAPPSPDMEWMTRIVWSPDELDDEYVRGVTPRPARDEAPPSPGAALPAPAITSASARATGDATQLRAPATQIAEGPAFAVPALQTSEPRGTETVMAPPVASMPTFEAGTESGTSPATVIGGAPLTPPVFSAGETAGPPTQTDIVAKMPGDVPQPLAPGGSGLPADTVLGFREVGPTPRLQTTIGPVPRLPDPPPIAAGDETVAPIAAGDETVAPVERSSETARRVARGKIQAVTLTGDAGTFVLAKGTGTVGRSSAATVRIDSQDVSRIHAVFVISDDAVSVEDRGSVNGTAVNGAIISGARPLQAGDRVSFADFEFRVDFKRSDDTP